jgi:hypothetical protein
MARIVHWRYPQLALRRMDDVRYNGCIGFTYRSSDCLAEHHEMDWRLVIGETNHYMGSKKEKK